MQLTKEHDTWFKQVLRDNGISISDTPDSTELLIIENEHKIEIKHFLFAIEVHINGKRIATYVDNSLDEL
jgi:organic hydroperoxide reductase OsmC/OhrA